MTLDELATETGLWPETLQTFIAAGALPPPDPERMWTAQHAVVARFVAHTQADYGLSLDAVARVLRGAHWDVHEAGGELLLHAGGLGPGGPGPTSLPQVARRAKAPETLARQLAAAGILPEAGPYSGHHVWIVQAAAELVDGGLDPALLIAMGDVAAEVAGAELDLLMGVVGRGASPREALERTGKVRGAVGRLVSAARTAGTTALMANLAAATARSSDLAAVAVHVPSPLFVSRFGLDLALERQRADAEAVLESSVTVIDASPVRAHGRLLLGVGRLREARQILERGLSHPGIARDGSVWATLGLVRGLQGEHEQAQQALDEASVRAPESPRVLAFRAAALAMSASRAGDLLKATVFIRDAMSVAEASRLGQPADTVEALEAWMTTGRICSVLPAGLIRTPAPGRTIEPAGQSVRSIGLEELRRVVDATTESAPPIDGLLLPGARELMHLNAVYYLGVALHAAEQTEEAAPLLREVLALDPASTYARHAYGLLANL